MLKSSGNPGILLVFIKDQRKMSEVLHVTEEGLQKLKEELEQLRTIERPMISRLIADARDKGDLSENAEYAAAKEAQGMLEMKISKLEDIIARSRIIDESKIDISTVRILNKVKIRNKSSNTIMEYQLVPESEANLKQGKIAVSSPMARGLIWKKVGDISQITVPSGVILFEIIAISM
ncbi:MAG: transcription elongation factor GreA [Bacteroidota bacterium]|nr:transcription elongation factor GreA [Bacteroidota bacterium]